MVVALHHPQRVLRHVLAGHEPRRVLAAAALSALFLDAADAQALALAQRVERQAYVPADHAALRVPDRPRLLADVAIQEVAEGPFADEADARGVLLPGVGQPDLRRDAPHLGLAQLADREQRLRQLRLVQAVQEVALVLAVVQALQELAMAARGRVARGRVRLPFRPSGLARVRWAPAD